MKKNNILFLFFLFIGINNLFAQINVSTGLNSTGGVGIQGSIDPNWQIASSPNPPGTPALVSSRHPLWQATPIAITNASWISQSGMFDNSPTGYYVFERAFTVGVASSLDCNFRIAYDDYLIGIELVAPNGTVVSLPVVINGYHLSNAITTSIPNPMTGVWKIRATVHFYDSVAAFMLSGSVNLPQPQTSLCLAPMEDALIHEFTPTTNYGASTTIRASRHTYGAGGGSGYYSTKGLYKFDLSGIPTNAVITSAILTLKTCPACTANGLDKHYDLSGLGNGATLKQVTSTWLENTVTWNTAPATAAAAVNIPSFGNNSTAPLIASVNSLMPASGGGNVSFMLSLADNSDYYHGVIFASKENIEVSIRPQLCITYTVPPCVNGLNAAHTTMPINTGVDDSGSMLPIGGTDTHWTASSGGFTVDNFYTGVWSGYPTNSQFIASNAGSTDYTFRRNFCIDPCSATQVNFNFKLFADNTACVYLDGITPLPLTWTSTSAAVTSCTQVIGIPQTPFLPTGGYTCNYTTTVPAGTHFLEVRVQNQSSSIAGLNVSGNISLVATPALALAATANCTGRSLSIAYANTNSNTLTWSVNGVLTSPTNAGSPATLPMPMSSCDTVFTVILTQTTPNTGCIKYDTVTVHANCCAPKFLVNTCNRNIVVTGMSNGNTSAPFSWTLIPCNNPTAQSYSGSTTMGQLFCTTQIDTGCYMLCLTLPNCPSACSGVCKQIRILPIPTLNLTTPNSAVCNGSNTSLTATTNVSLGSSFAWSSGGRTATITVAPAITTTYICTVTNSTGCTATASYIISVSACCISSIIKNSSFETGSTGGIGGSNLGYDGNTNNWSVAQGSPQLSPIGNLDSWSMQMWGVCEVTNAGGTGEAVKQTTVPFIAGHTYSISFTAQKMPMANTYNPIIVLRTTNTPLGMAGATVIASGTATSGSWQTFTATWTAPSGPSLDQLIISVHNASTINTGSLVSWARVDHVCIVDNGLSMNYCA